MSEPFLAEIRIVGFDFAPRGWALCDGKALPIDQNQSLYSLLGTTYGSDGPTTFALPDLRGRTPIHAGASDDGVDHRPGQKGGKETHTLDAAEMPRHTHSFSGSSAQGTTDIPQAGQVLAGSGRDVYRDQITNLTPLDPGAVTDTGGGQAHENVQPFLALNFCIALQGLFPSRN